MYIASGLDPARFWNITPRMLAMELAGAKLRLRRERELVWWGAMLPHLKKPVTLDQFLGGHADDRDRVRRFHDAWDKVDRALKRH